MTLQIVYKDVSPFKPTEIGRVKCQYFLLLGIDIFKQYESTLSKYLLESKRDSSDWRKFNEPQLNFFLNSERNQFYQLYKQ